jgi:hypothetical protein
MKPAKSAPSATFREMNRDIAGRARHAFPVLIAAGALCGLVSTLPAVTLPEPASAAPPGPILLDQG